MPKIKRKLTEAEIKNAKPRETDHKLYDEGGLYLLIRTSGTKVWRLPYQIKKDASATKAQYNIYTLSPAVILTKAVMKLLLRVSKHPLWR